MSQIISVPTKTLQEILSRLDQLSKEVADIKDKLFSGEPPYGSDEWWEWSDRKALEEIKAGKGIKISNQKELDQFFKNLKNL